MHRKAIRTLLAALTLTGALAIAAPAAARPVPAPPKMPRTPAPAPTAQSLVPISPGTRLTLEFPIIPGLSDQGSFIQLPAGKVPMAMGYYWGPADATQHPYAPAPGGPDNPGGDAEPYGVRFRSTNARLIMLNTRDGYVWRVYIHVDAAADADPDARITLWVIYL